MGRPAGVRFPNTPTHRGARIGLAGATAPHRTGGPASDWRGQGAASDWRPRIGRRPRIGPTRARGASDPHTRTRGARTLGPGAHARSDPHTRTHGAPVRLPNTSSCASAALSMPVSTPVSVLRVCCACARGGI
ncbi:hypothetical protein SEA_MORI_126 [Mycobacterium phage Mori]|nr:hypothetical protein SEA_MORI_126 [Mycobacterium phage Mori]